MATLGMHRDFLLEFAGLEKHVQRRVFETFEKFTEATHAGAHLEKITHQRDPRLRTIRITDYWRGVVLKADHGDTYLMLKVLPHDKANEWAAKHRVSVNEATQGVEIRNDVALERATAGMRAAAADERKRLFAAHSDKVLRSLGIDEGILPIIRLIPDEAHLEALHGVLPEQQYDVLLGLATGMSPEEIDRELVQSYLRTAAMLPGAGGYSGLSAAMARSRGRVALVSGPAELMEILARPFDTWRVFLHPRQHWIAYRDSYSGPARVTGGPGTGKTVVALHRAYHLARQLPPAAPAGSILLTTYSRNLAFDLERCLELLIADDAVRAKVRVVDVDALAGEIAQRGHGGASRKLIVDQKEITARWARVVRRRGLDFAAVFLDQEWRYVILAQALDSLQSYLEASRSGRGTALGPARRAQLWQAVEEFEQQMRQAGESTPLQVCAEAAELLDKWGERPFRHVVVDESQDLHPAQWRFLRALAAQGPDDLFIAGDPHQQIYGNKVSLRSLGIHVAGRSSRLRINYRTTHEILTWAASLLTGEGPGDATDGEDSLAAYRSTLHGAHPQVRGHADQDEEIRSLAAQTAEWIAAGVAPEEIGVAVRLAPLGREIAWVLKRSGIPVCVLGARYPGAGVRIGTMHRMKGLEFRCVLVAGVAEGTVPLRSALTPWEVDAQQHQQDLDGERNLLFVACTRAREALRVSWHGLPSPFLAPVTVDRRRSSGRHARPVSVLGQAPVVPSR